MRVVMVDDQPDHNTASVQLARSFVSAISHPATVLDAQGRVLLPNSDFLNGLATTQDDVIGRSIEAVFLREDSNRISKALTHLKNGNPVARIAVSLPSGLFELKMDILDISQSPLYLCQLTPNEAIDGNRLRFLMDHLDQGVWTYNVLTDCFSANDAWRRMRHLEADANVSGEPGQIHGWLDDVHPDDRGALRAITDAQRAGTQNELDVQYRNRRADGSWLWVLARARVMAFGANGRPVQIVGIDTDITEIKENEAAMARLAEKMRLAIDVAGIGVYEFDTATGRVNWDDRLLEMYGIKDGQHDRPGHLWETYLHPDDRDRTMAKAEKAIDHRIDFIDDYRVLRPDGEERHLRSIARCVDVDGTTRKLVGVNIDITDDVRRAEELEIAHERLEHDSRHDALTGLANRRLLDETVEDLLENMQGDTAFAALHLDLDHFKHINDTKGHAAGDAVLVQVAQILTTLVGDTGLVCRVGGDEFVVLLPSVTSPHDVERLCRAVISQVARPMTILGEICEVGVSIGCALGHATTDMSQIFVNADTALYAAKADGRSRFLMFKDGMRPVTRHDASALQALLTALTEGQITSYLQPQFDAKTQRMVGAEALARWHCPACGLLMPDQFLPIAEKAGLIARIDEFVFDHIMALQTSWARDGLDIPPISLNVSLERLREDGFIDDVRGALAPHHKISFELLETAFLDDTDTDVTVVLDQLRALGLRIDLDDFGSGRSSIVALQAVKPDRVKIDRRLVAPLLHNQSQILTLKSLVHLARLEGCEVVMEGVETPEQIAAVSALDCAVLQGFGLSRPMPVNDFVAAYLVNQGVMTA
ncbi:EAL domain-containing protein [Octadecabacter sp.]|nr:EAL domain-containing protein [Octadecabacter sp.]